MTLKNYFVPVMGMILAGCGGGNGGSNDVITVVPPTILPTPTPTPVATPSPSYYTLDLSRSFALPALSSELRIVERYQDDAPRYYVFDRGTAAIDDIDKTLLDWNVATGRYAIIRNNTEIFEKSDLMTEYPDNGIKFLRFFRTLQNHPTLSPYDSRQIASFGKVYDSFDYVLGGGWENLESYFDAETGGKKVIVSTERRFLAGTPTPASDTAATGSASYSTSWSANFNVDGVSFGIGWQLQPMSIDYAQHTVRGEFDAAQSSWTTGSEPIRVRVTLDASYDPSSGRITGTLRSADSAFAGSVLGRFFGPRADSIGMVMRMTWTGSKYPIAGTIVGKR